MAVEAPCAVLSISEWGRNLWGSVGRVEPGLKESLCTDPHRAGGQQWHARTHTTHTHTHTHTHNIHTNAAGSLSGKGTKKKGGGAEGRQSLRRSGVRRQMETIVGPVLVAAFLWLSCLQGCCQVCGRERF